MSWHWFAASISILLGVVCFLPFVFEREAMASRFFSLCYQLKFYQHLFPGDRVRSGRIISELNTQKDRWLPLGFDTIGSRMRTIRELTGGDYGNHILAVELSGGLIQELAASGWICAVSRHAEAPLSATDIIHDLVGKLVGDIGIAVNDPEKDSKLREWLRNNEIDLEQVVELALAVIELLHARVEIERARRERNSEKESER